MTSCSRVQPTSETVDGICAWASEWNSLENTRTGEIPSCWQNWLDVWFQITFPWFSFPSRLVKFEVTSWYVNVEVHKDPVLEFRQWRPWMHCTCGKDVVGEKPVTLSVFCNSYIHFQELCYCCNCETIRDAVQSLHQPKWTVSQRWYWVGTTSCMWQYTCS